MYMTYMLPDMPHQHLHITELHTYPQLGISSSNTFFTSDVVVNKTNLLCLPFLVYVYLFSKIRKTQFKPLLFNPSRCTFHSNPHLPNQRKENHKPLPPSFKSPLLPHKP
ncbi:hypothetical protein COCSADRAFT_317975 [Bipolaris sorokiniana ND90Pr]|uniref:Uncharacterized protein n=1 Tax=Cochliobolus sativus (strain ND90Pr / ATCC 201652) TaxID=665912 RepID=M2T7A1_COCSN|nr:uncharacterized protein COCSADRAFT_317975 [Bipolaris sorokiniana ND90Pr]EMD65091.1 hypothetical protein COCSADRAFT_317975 [Bipolaris sorokiniana ND90Pr]